MPVPSVKAMVAKRLLREDSYRALRDAIVDGTLTPGERLNDTELVAWLGVSRTPIREALARLEQAGLVHTQPGRYTMVAPVEPSAIRSARHVAAAMHELATRTAVPVLSASDLRAMRAANTRFAAALRAGDIDDTITADTDFHEIAVTACANPVLRSALEQVTPSLRRMERLHFDALRARDSVDAHARIIRLAAIGDADGAALAARENWYAPGALLEDAPSVAE